MTNSSIPGYRETDAGWILEDWASLSLGTIASARKSKAVAQQGVRCVELEHIEPETGRLLGWDSSGAQASIKTAFKQGDVLFGKLRPYLRKYAVAPFDGICTTEILAIHPKDDLADGSFLFQLMQGDGVFSTVEALSYGTKMPRVSWSDLADIVVGVPSLAEQRGVAAILKAVDDKLDVIARQIEATQTLKQGLMQTLFSQGVGTQDADGRWVPHTEFKDTDQGRAPAVWSVQTLEQVAVVERGKFSARPRNDPKYFEGGDIPFVQTGDVAKSGRLISTASQFLNEAGLGVSKRFEPGTIFLTIAANIGDVAIAAIPMACPDSVVGIRAVEGACDAAWLYYLLYANKGYFDSRATQNAQKNINLQVLRPFRFAMPPPAEQAQIGLVLTTLDEKLESLGKRLHHHQTLKRGLMQKLLTGEWRVKVDSGMAA
jgi:type I restriction enzyme, S subunit